MRGCGAGTCNTERKSTLVENWGFQAARVPRGSADTCPGGGMGGGGWGEPSGPAALQCPADTGQNWGRLAPPDSATSQAWSSFHTPPSTSPTPPLSPRSIAREGTKGIPCRGRSTRACIQQGCRRATLVLQPGYLSVFLSDDFLELELPGERHPRIKL